MKNIITPCFIFFVFANLTIAQITIIPNGNTGVGTMTPSEKLEVSGLVLAEGTTTSVTGASATALVERTDGSAMLFGSGNNSGLTIDDNFAFQVRTRPRSFVLARSLSGGSYLMVSDGGSGNSAFGYSSAAASTHRLRVNGSIQATAFAPLSDRKLKKDVEKFDVGLAALMKLNPITFKYNGMAGIKCSANQVGIFAQELQKVAPILVNEETYYELDDRTGRSVAKDNYLSINDTGIKYILINAIKEQQKQIEAKDEVMAELNEEMNVLKGEMKVIRELLEKVGLSSGGSEESKHEINLVGSSMVSLGQNIPNPFTSETTIEYNVDVEFKSAMIQIFNVTGQLIHTETIRQRGAGVVLIKTTDMTNGSYNYSLIVDGRKIDTKTMVLTK